MASTLGVLGSVARKYAHKIPFIVKINHNELLTYPNKHDQILFASVEQAFDLGAAAVGATVYYGSEESSRQIMEISAKEERGLDEIAYVRFASVYRKFRDISDFSEEVRVLLQEE